jgi:sulfite reductase beta subunit-like hemoprotein
MFGFSTVNHARGLGLYSCRKAVEISPSAPAGFEEWRKTNVAPQRQPGYVTAMVTLPLGDITAAQLRKVADACRKYVKETIRITVEQNLLLRWVSEADLPALFAELKDADLGQPGAGTIADVTACSGTDICKLGISSSRGLPGELRMHLMNQNGSLDEAVCGFAHQDQRLFQFLRAAPHRRPRVLRREPQKERLRRAALLR